MLNEYSDDQLRMVARLYYLDGLGQNEVAQFAKVSQAKISRLLAAARERGIVRISVSDYDPRRHELEEKLKAQLRLSSVVVLKHNGGLENADLRRSVGHFGASVVDTLIQPGDVVALAGGRTLHELIQHLPATRTKSLTVVQAMGSVDSNVSVFDAQEVGRVLSQRLGGVFLSLNTPAFVPEKGIRDAILQLEQVRSVHAHLNRARVALVGLGTLANSVFVERGTVTPAMSAELTAAGAVGEICGRFINAAGDECATSWRDRVIGVEIDQLRKIPQVIAIVSGSDRSAAILAAVAGRLIKSLVIDELGASALLAQAQTLAAVTPPRKKAKK